MKVELERTFPLSAAADVGWEFLTDVEAVAACMPGAKITEHKPDGGYKGTVTVKLGPATMSFRGDLEVRDVDPAARSLRLVGKGTDTTGSSGASMDLLARVEPVAQNESRLVGKSEVSMSGKAAAFGGRMMNSVADQVLKQFAAQFAAQVAARASQRAAAAESAEASVPAAEAGRDVAGDLEIAPKSAGPSATAPAAPPPVRELNGLALLWAIVRDWLRGLFGRKSA